MLQELTKDEKKAIRKLEWQKKEKLEKRNAMFKKYSVWFLTIGFILLGIAGLFWLISQPSTSSTTVDASKIAPITSRDIATGPKNAPVKLIEYADFECPACGVYHPLVHQLLTNYKDKIYYVYRMFPLENVHPNALSAAQAAYAAYKQGAFFNYDDYLYNNQNDWAQLPDPTSKYIEYAQTLKLDVNKFKADLNSAETKKYVNASEQEALSEGIMATPTFILNGKQITNPQSYDEFKKIIDNAINSK